MMETVAWLSSLPKEFAIKQLFYPRDAMLARHAWPCVSAFLSQVGVLSKRLIGRSWILTRRLPSSHPTLCFKDILVHPKITALSSGTLSQPKLWMSKEIRHGASTVAKFCQLSLTDDRHQFITCTEPPCMHVCVRLDGHGTVVLKLRLVNYIA